jgi:hypothetical protein
MGSGIITSEKLYPQYIDLETISSCNRFCPTCIRNSHPNREAVASWFGKNYLALDIIEQVFQQAVDWNFPGGICLSHFNEPLMDERFVKIAQMAKRYDFYPLFCNTNGDYITEELAVQLDGVLDKINISLYMAEPIKSERKRWLETLFHKTKYEILNGEHIPSHYTPKFPLQQLIAENIDHDCIEPEMRIIINHRRQYLLCCEDLIGNFNLGNFPDITLWDHWQGRQKQIRDTLRNVGGRRQYAHCSICPKT